MSEQLTEARDALKTPRAAAVAGLIFAVLYTTSMAMIRQAVPESLSDAQPDAWFQRNSGSVSLALTLLPFAGIAFLWFMGVVRDRLGRLEDQLFATVFFGSGLLFLASMFGGAAVAGGMLDAYRLVPEAMTSGGAIPMARAISYTFINVYGVRMAGVFMISLGTIWLRTGNMPRLLALLTYGLALILLVGVGLKLWLILVFPAWVSVISLYILVMSLRGGPAVR